MTPNPQSGFGVCSSEAPGAGEPGGGGGHPPSGEFTGLLGRRH
jgi:hypothetical protein